MAGALVWFKRDLRVRDHAPLAAAQHFEAAAGLVVIESQWLGSPECDSRHVAFFLDSIKALQATLSELGLPLLVRVGDVIDVLQDVRREFAFSHLFSHEETGTGWSYARDSRVADWCRHQGLQWTEFPQTGVVRRLRSRNGWAARWSQRMNANVSVSKPHPGWSLHRRPAPQSWVWSRRQRPPQHRLASRPRGRPWRAFFRAGDETTAAPCPAHSPRRTAAVG